MAAQKQAIGVVGLGIIGSRVAANLRRAGYEVWVWNRSPKSEPNFLSSAAEVAETADIILFFVPDGPALMESIRAMQPTLAARHLLINHATVSPVEAREAAELAAKSSAGFLDAPFTGSRDAAEAGQIVYYVAGASDWAERARPVLSASARSIIDIGTEIGQASLIKLATNLIAAATAEALAEAMALVSKNGISATKFLEAFALNATRSGLADMKLPAMITGDFEPRFALKHMAKDIQLVLEAGKAAGVELPAAAAAAGVFSTGVQQGWGDLDFAAVARRYDFPGSEPLITNALETLREAEGSKPKPKLLSIFGGPRNA
jgi:3-hydroxyisobutyrate dehydrogenase-like beta-hydroxyacid dehydrogenase